MNAKLNGAAQLLNAQRYDECIAAYQAVADQHPEARATCHGQIGACYFFKGEFSMAIQNYVTAKEYGASPGIMDDNIQEAQEAMALANRELALPPLPTTAPIRGKGLLLAVPVAIAALLLLTGLCVGGAALMAG